MASRTKPAVAGAAKSPSRPGMGSGTADAKDGDAKDKTTFRMRRLSVTDKPQESEDYGSDASPGGGTTPQRRARRMSMSPEMGVLKPRAVLPFPPETVGTYSCHGVEPGVRQGETNAKINQDRGCVVFPFGPEMPGCHQALFCVFDGHGACGDKVSHFTMSKIHQRLEEREGIISDDPAVALKEVFVAVDEELRKDPSIDAELSGTTAVVCLCRYQTKSPNEVLLWVANAGDSRAVLGKKVGDKTEVTDLSEDQKPDTPAEMRRIKKKGGFVSPPEEEWGGPARVWLDASQTLPGLAMARSIGDHLVKSIGVIAEPEVTLHVVPIDSTFMIMASDGVWEFLESDKAAELVNNFIWANATDACTRLIETAATKWRAEEGDYRDDITAICVRFQDLFSEVS